MSLRSLLRPTLVLSKAIFKFSVFINYMYYVFFTIRTYIYYTKNTGGLYNCLDRMTFREGFQASLKGFKTVLSPQAVFCTLIFI